MSIFFLLHPVNDINNLLQLHIAKTLKSTRFRDFVILFLIATLHSHFPPWLPKTGCWQEGTWIVSEYLWNAIWLLMVTKCKDASDAMWVAILNNNILFPKPRFSHSSLCSKHNQKMFPTKVTGIHFDQRGHSVSDVRITILEKMKWWKLPKRKGKIPH